MYKNRLSAFLLPLVFILSTFSTLESVDILDKVMDNKKSTVTKSQKKRSKRNQTASKKKKGRSEKENRQSSTKYPGLGVARSGWVSEELAIQPSHLEGIAAQPIQTANLDTIEPTTTLSPKTSEPEKNQPDEKKKSLLEEFDLLTNNPFSNQEKTETNPSYVEKVLGNKKTYIILGLVVLFVFFRMIAGKYGRPKSDTISRYKTRK